MGNKVTGWITAVLLAGVASVAPDQTTAKPTVTAESHMGTPMQLQWGPAPAGMPVTAKAAMLDGDPTQPGFFVVRLRLPDGTQIRPHWHSQDEHVTVIAGRFGMGLGDRWDEAKMTVL